MEKTRINDLDVEYEVILRKVKYPRLEIKTGSLRVIVPEGYDGAGKLVEKHRKWIYNRLCMSKTLAPEADPEWTSNIVMTLKATLGINGVAKMVRHNLELAKKTGNLQILLMLQMSLPMIMRIVKAQYDGMHGFAHYFICKYQFNVDIIF